MKLRYAVAALIVVLAGCSASHTASPTSALPGAPNFGQQKVVNPFNLNVKHIVNTYPANDPYFMATGSDKNVWYTEINFARIGKITPTGVITEYAIPSGNDGYDIAPGFGGTMWFDENLGTTIGEITTAGQVTEFALSGAHTGGGLAKGSDGNMWFDDQVGNSIAKITPTGTVTEYPLPTNPDYPYDLVAGPDGNLWYSAAYGHVGKVTTSGTITEYVGPDSVNVNAIAAGPDGNLYATEDNGIYKVTTNGTITEFTGGLSGYDIALGPDKQMWITRGQLLAEFNPKTDLFAPTIDLDGNNFLWGLTVGSDGDAWISDGGGNNILVYEEQVTTVGIRLNGEMSFTDPNYGFELGYALGTGTQTQTISLSMGESVEFKNLDTIPHSAAFLGNATANNAPWPATFTGSTIKSPAGTAIGTTGWTTGSLNPNRTSPIYETGLPGFYMIGDQYDYVSNNMRTVIVVH
jgi:streptogramin lyase